MIPRYPETFRSVDATILYQFGPMVLEIRETQKLRTAFAVVNGADFAHNYLGFGMVPKDMAQGTLTWYIPKPSPLVVSKEELNPRALFQRIGTGKLYTRGVDGSSRWAYIQPQAVPVIGNSDGQYRRQQVTVDYDRLSEWVDATQNTGSQVIGGSPVTFTITNKGNLPAKILTLTLAAGAASGFNQPIITNNTNLYSIATSAVANGSSDRWRVVGGDTVYYSTDGGVTYGNDYNRAIIGVKQVGLFVLQPGANSITVTNCTNATLTWAFDEPYA